MPWTPLLQSIDRLQYAQPDSLAVQVALVLKVISTRSGFDVCEVAEPFDHQGGAAPYVDVGNHGFHLHRYLSEFDFRYNARKITDAERAEKALKGAAGKRLMYRRSYGA